MNTATAKIAAPEMPVAQTPASKQLSCQQLCPKLTKEGLNARVDVITSLLKANGSHPISELMKRQNVRPSDVDQIYKSVKATHRKLADFLKCYPHDGSAPENRLMLNALCDFVLAERKLEKSLREQPGYKPGCSALILMECLDALSDVRVTSDPKLSSKWTQVRKDLNRTWLELTSRPGERSPYEIKLPKTLSDSPLETAEVPLSPIWRIVAFEIRHNRDTSNVVCHLLELTRTSS